MKASETSNAGSREPALAEKSRRPFARFAAPEDVLIERDLGRRERACLLEDWKRELERDSGITQPDEMLRRIDACRRLLGEQEH